MLFNSIDFAIFLPVVFILYWFICNKSLKLQNILIVIASYVFYGWWDWRFLSLILFSTVVDYTIGIALSKQEHQTKRKLLLWTSILINLGLLCFFKYYNFFLENFTDAFSFFGSKIQADNLNIILPVGISFYTFQTLSYTIDVYKQKLEPTKDIVAFSAFVSFFPQLVAGPIERASNLLPQFYKKRTFNYQNAMIGVRQIIWGLFKKIVIADTCSQYVNEIFKNYETHSSLTLIIGAICFSFQIYCDFSGYSDIAIGTSRLFGFNLMKNFKYPYFSRDIAEFWRRWHISLSTWFRDYIYIPLGGSHGSKWSQVRNVFIIFIVSGFWHGANWTFVTWGALNAVYFLPLLLFNKNRKHIDIISKDSSIPTFKELILILNTFILTTFSWIFFRSENLEAAFLYIKRILAFNLDIERLQIERYPFEIFPLILLLIIIEWYYRNEEFPLFKDNKYMLKSIFIILCILMFGSFSDLNDFIYFQF